jgi:lipopolysaccharide assembly outer membrane protein LptD (OstA)
MARTRALLVLVAWFALLAGLAPPAGAQDAAAAPTRIVPHGPQYGYPDPDHPDRFVWVFLNGVEVSQPGRRIIGDTLVAVLLTGDESGQDAPAPAEGMLVPGTHLLELYIDGNVRVEEGEEQITGASAFHLDNATGVATVVEGELRTSIRGGEPLAARFALLKRLQDGSVLMDELTYTTCDFEHPHWHIKSPYARLIPTDAGRILSTGGNTVKVGAVPVLWLPGLDMNVDEGGLMLVGVHVGQSSRFGTEIETRWRADGTELVSGLMSVFGYDTPVTAEWNLGIDSYSRRGLFLEPELSYETEDSRGRLLTAYINDKADTDDLEVPITDDTRGRVDLEHRTRIGEHGVLDIEVSRQSDRNFLNEYYEREFKDDKPQETYVSYRHVVDNQALTVLGSTRLNDFDTQVEYQPEVVGRQLGVELFDGAFLTAKEYISNARLLPDDETSDPSVRNTRMGVDTTLVVPLDLPNGDRIDLVTELGATAFEDSVSDGSTTRTAAGVGVNWSRTYTGVGDTQSDTWNLDGLRRIVQPRLSYFDRFNVSRTPAELLQIDEIETLSEETVFSLGVRDRIQTHQDGHVVTILDTDISLPFYPNDRRDNEGKEWGLLLLDTRWKPGANVPGLRQSELYWRTEFDAQDQHYAESFASWSTVLSGGNRLTLSNDKVFHEFDYRTLALEWGLNPKWSMAVYLQQDTLNDETVRSGILLRQYAHCWFIDVELSTRRGTDANGNNADDTSVSVRFQPAVLDRDNRLADSIGSRLP